MTDPRSFASGCTLERNGREGQRLRTQAQSLGSTRSSCSRRSSDCQGGRQTHGVGGLSRTLRGGNEIDGHTRSALFYR